MSFHQAKDHNVGIVDFFEGKTIFITGSTGFIGKVFVEKLLRAVPLVQKIYLLVRANDEQAAMQRVKSEIIDCKLFKVLREKHGESYEEFMWNKLVPIVGDLCKPYLGIDPNLANVIRDDVNVIVHTGGNTKWNDRHDKSLEVNVTAVSRVVDFALDCTKIALYLHVSSVFVIQTIPGFEKLVELEQHRKEDGKTTGLSVEQLIDEETGSISEVTLRFHKEEQTTEMLKLGMRRAKLYNLQNNYLLTKSMGELVAASPRGKLPVVIIRPSLVESTFKEPFPGWVEGYKVLEPIILSYGTGELEEIVANPSATLDVVPVDMVVNAMMAAIAKHGNDGKNGVNIYNVASSLANPLSCHDFFKFTTDFFTKHPIKDVNGNDIAVKHVEFFDSMDELILVGLRDHGNSNAKLQNKLLRIAAIYDPVLSVIGACYHDENSRKLLGEMSLDELSMFNFNLKCINWKDYFANIHIPGLIQHVIKKKALLAKL